MKSVRGQVTLSPIGYGVRILMGVFVTHTEQLT